MRVDETKCVGCEACIPYCPVEAISMGLHGIALVDEEVCVECGNCQRASKEICGAFYRPEESLQWPRVLRAVLSDTTFVSPIPQVKSRGGGGGQKTNDVDGKYWPGEIGVGVELGRPNSGVCFRDVEKVTKALAQIGMQFDPDSPTTRIMDDPANGTFSEDMLKQRALTVFVYFSIDEEALGQVMKVISKQIQSLSTLTTITLEKKLNPARR